MMVSMMLAELLRSITVRTIGAWADVLSSTTAISGRGRI